MAPKKPMSDAQLEQHIKDLNRQLGELKSVLGGEAGGGHGNIQSLELAERLQTEIEAAEAQLAERQQAAQTPAPSDPFHLDGLTDAQLRAKLSEVNKQIDLPVDEKFQVKLGEHFAVYKADKPNAVLDDATTALLREEIGAEMRAESERLEKMREAIQDKLTGDTGHYDDGHAFGWKSKEPEGDWTNLTGTSSKRNVRIAAGVAIAALVVGGAIVAAGGGSDAPKTKPASAPSNNGNTSSNGGVKDPAPVQYTMDVTQTVGPPSCTTTRLIKVQFLNALSSITGERAILHVEGPGGTDVPFEVPASGAIDLTFVENVPATANGCSGTWEYSITTVAGRTAERQLSG